jgi:hypothetical protein
MCYLYKSTDGFDFAARNAYQPRADFQPGAGVRQILPEGMTDERIDQAVTELVLGLN